MFFSMSYDDNFNIILGSLEYINNFQGKPHVPPFTVVINGIKSGPSNGYNYKYSYNYGYGYGYGNEKK